MKFSLPKYLAKTASPILLTSWVFGIGVIEFPMGKPRPVISALWSTVNFLIYLGFLRMANLSEIVTVHGSKLAAHNYRTNAYLCAAFVATSICLAQISVKMSRNYRHTVDVLNERLKMLGIPTDFVIAMKSQLIQIAATYAYTCILMALDFQYVGFDLPSHWSRIGALMISHYLMMFVSIVDGYFIASIGYLGNRFQRLNKLLQESNSTARTKTRVTRKSDDEFQRYSSVISEIYRNNSLAIKAAEKQWLLYVIGETRSIHRALCKLAMTVNRNCGIQVIFSVGLSINMITALFYSCYDIIVSSSASSLLHGNWTPKILTAMWITFYAMRVILMVDTCNTTSCEAKRTEGLVNKLLDAESYDDDIRDEIEIFSLQLLQNPLNLTANGFFVLDYSLVHRMIGSVTTYLIIMIQMNNIYQFEDVNSSLNSTMLMQTHERD